MKIVHKGKPLCVLFFAWPHSGSAITTNFFNSIKRCLFIIEANLYGFSETDMPTRYGLVNLKAGWGQEQLVEFAVEHDIQMCGYSDIWTPAAEEDYLFRQRLAERASTVHRTFVMLRNPLRQYAAWIGSTGNLKKKKQSEFVFHYLRLIRLVNEIEGLQPFFFDKFVSDPKGYSSEMIGKEITGKIELVLGENRRGHPEAIASTEIHKDQRKPHPPTKILEPAVEAYEDLRAS